MSGENDTPITGADAPLPNGADTSAVADKAEPVAEKADADFLADDAESKAAPVEGKADDGKAGPESKDKADDFLAETDDDEAQSKADAPGDAKQDGEPEAYQPFTLPEGQKIDEAALAKATPVFRELKLDQDGAQKLVSLQADIMQQAVQGYHETLAEGHANTLKTWAAETKAHPEFGGANLKASKALAAKALGLEPQARAVLVEYGLDRNPHVFALLARIGSKFSDDSLVRDDAGAPVKDTPARDADLMYS